MVARGVVARDTAFPETNGPGSTVSSVVVAFWQLLYTVARRYQEKDCKRKQYNDMECEVFDARIIRYNLGSALTLTLIE